MLATRWPCFVGHCVGLKRLDSGSGVLKARGVAGERACAQAGVALRHRNPRQREREYESSNTLPV